MLDEQDILAEEAANDPDAFNPSHLIPEDERDR